MGLISESQLVRAAVSVPEEQVPDIPDDSTSSINTGNGLLPVNTLPPVAAVI